MIVSKIQPSIIAMAVFKYHQILRNQLFNSADISLFQSLLKVIHD